MINETHPCNDDMTVRLVTDYVFQVLLRSSETTPIEAIVLAWLRLGGVGGGLYFNTHAC